jgi:hypothetical protein
MYYTPLSNYSVSEHNLFGAPVRAPVRAPLMADMTAISPTTGELMVPGNAGVVIQAKSGDNAIRISGTATTTAGLVSNGTTANQIQFYSNGNICAAFDSRGLYLVDNDWINIGSGKIVIYTGAGNLLGNLVIGSVLSGSKVTGGALYNTFLGQTTGEENTTGNQNTFIGFGAGRFNTTGGGNTSVGVNAGQNQSTGSNNVYIGQNAGMFDKGTTSVYIGSGAGGGQQPITGSNNNCIGASTGLSLTLGNANTFIGKDAGAAVTTGSGNNYIGMGAGQTVTTGENNVGIGHYAGGSFQASNAERNTCVGGYAGQRLTTGGNNTLLGYASSPFLTTGDRNTCIGKNAGYNISSGLVNVCVGENSGIGITTGQNNITIGQNSNVSGNNTNNETVIGSNLEGNGTGTTTISGNSIYFTPTGRKDNSMMYMTPNSIILGRNTGTNDPIWCAANNNAGIMISNNWNNGNPTPGTVGYYKMFCNGDNNIYIDFHNQLVYRCTSQGGTSVTNTPLLINNGGLVVSGSIIGYSSLNPSDLRLKNTIEPINTALDAILKLKPSTFFYNAKPDKKFAGFIAQDILPILPLAVEKGEDDYYNLNQTCIIPYLVKAVQELSAQVTELTKQMSLK